MLNRLLILTVIGGLLPLAAESWWGFELLTHFRLQYLAVAAALLLVAIGSRRKWLTLLLATTIAVNAWPLRPYLPATATPVAGEALAILNINVNADNGEHDRILETIRRANADIVTIIELTPELDARLVSLEADYPYRLTRPASGNFGIGLISRHQIPAAEIFELGPTQAIEAVVRIGTRDLRAFAAHPVPPMSNAMAATRNSQLTELAARIASTPGPLLVCGDLNLTPYSPYFQSFERISVTRDVRRGLGFGISWPTFMPLLGIPIDHCLVRGDLSVEAVERLDRTGSDHYPVLTTLRW